MRKAQCINKRHRWIQTNHSPAIHQIGHYFAFKGLPHSSQQKHIGCWSLCDSISNIADRNHIIGISEPYWYGSPSLQLMYRKVEQQASNRTLYEAAKRHPSATTLRAVRPTLPIRTGALSPAGHAEKECYNGPDRRVQMILPQVHLRKPCYDFSFL